MQLASQPVNLPNKPANKPANHQASKPTNQQTSMPANQQASKHTSSRWQ